MRRKRNDSVWVAIGYTFCGDDAGNPQLDDKMRFPIRDHNLGLFTTRKKAEAFIRHYLKEIDYEAWLGFILEERPLDLTSKQKYCYMYNSASYDAKGKLITTSIYDDPLAPPFRGRKKQIPFKEGDVVLVPWGDCAVPSLLVSLPPDEKWWRKRMSPMATGDWTDDAALTVSWKSGHDHPSATSIFYYPGAVPQYVKDCLNEEYTAYMNGKL